MLRFLTSLFFCCINISVVYCLNGPPDSVALQQILSDAGYSNWTEAEKFLRTQMNPSLPQFVREFWTMLKHKGAMWNCSAPGPKPPKLQFFFTSHDAAFFIIVLTTSCLLVRLRQRISPMIAQWAICSGVRAQDAIKTPECVWKGLTHAILWLVSFYVVVLSGRYNFFHEPCAVWNGITWNAHLDKAPIPFDMRLIYGLQLSHYFHALYATLSFETKRTDYKATVVHHFVTISLLACSYSLRFFYIGALVLLLHDVSDVLLELTKLNVYFRVRHGKVHNFNKYMSDIGFLVFTISWALCRLYWYPVKVLHACGWCPVIRHGCVDPPLFYPFNGLLWSLQFLHIYWFGFIILLVYKIVTGQIREVEDTREPELHYDHRNGDSCDSIYANGGTSKANGILKHRKLFQGPSGDMNNFHREKLGPLRTVD
ncbi:LAG1 longevity assurance 1 [Fasciola gigantica]|uniref:LAG1 longevity assurance 1 n=1 Tax=Fasciola gigantica TaxID=46835 RepID=A0A504YZJ5_FASGI|nr:LAG1 longevity assurance 1 [Fasciola gigantica]